MDSKLNVYKSLLVEFPHYAVDSSFDLKIENIDNNSTIDEIKGQLLRVISENVVNYVNSINSQIVNDSTTVNAFKSRFNLSEEEVVEIIDSTVSKIISLIP